MPYWTRIETRQSVVCCRRSDSGMRVARDEKWRGERVYPLAVFPALFSFRYPHNMNAWNMPDKEKPLFLKVESLRGGQLSIAVTRSMLVSETRARS